MPAPSPSSPESLPRQALGLAAWTGLWLLLEGLFRRLGLGDRQQLAILLAALALAGALAAGARLFQLLTSVRFAVVQGLFLVAAALLGSLGVPLGPDPFHSLWFSALLALLAASTLAVTWKRRPYPLARMGFLLVHAAPALVLLGALWGRFQRVRATGALPPGVTVDRLGRDGGREPFPLPGFGLRLEPDPARPPEPRLYAFSPGGTAAGVREVRPGAATLMPDGIRVDLLQVLPDAVETGQVMEDPLAPADPALRVVLGLGLSTPLVGHLFAQGGERSRQDAPSGAFAVVFREAWDDAFLATFRPAPARAETLELSAGGRTLRHPAGPGASWQLPGFTLRVTHAYPDFAVRPGPGGEPEAYSRSDSPREPWLELELAAGAGPPRKLLLSARQPALTDRLNAPHLPAGTRLRYLREGEEGQRRFVVFTRADRQVRLLEDGRLVRTEPLVLRRPFIVEPGLSVTADAILEHTEPVFAANPGPGPGHPVLRVRAGDPRNGSAEACWLEPGTRERPAAPRMLLGGRLGLVYRDRPAGPGERPPDLVLVDSQGRELARGPLAAGQPLEYAGLTFHPDPDAPWGEGVRVVREPGLGLMAAGFACLLAGCAWMFYLKPVLKRREGRP